MGTVEANRTPSGTGCSTSTWSASSGSPAPPCPYLRASAAAVVVNTCSIAATVGLPSRALYSATKGAVQSLTLAMAADHLAEGIRVCCVNPGTADTPGSAGCWPQPPTQGRAPGTAGPPAHGSRLVAAEVAAAIAYLASPLAGATTGTVLAVDGGMHDAAAAHPPSS